MVPASAVETDVVRLTMDSQPGDYIGGGQFHQYTPDDGTFSVTSSSGGQQVRVRFSGEPGTWWTLTFQAPDGTTLTRGPYEDATRAPFSSPTKPGLDVSGSGRGCNTLEGRFDVREIAIDGDGTVDRLAVDFEQLCTGSTAPLLGQILYRADEPFAPPQDSDGDLVPDTLDNCDQVANPGQGNADHDLLGDACDSTFDNTNLTFDSEPGDYIGQGIQETWHLEDGTITASGTPETVSVNFDGGPTNWRLSFDAPDGTELAPGTYEAATRHPFNADDVPGLSVAGSGRGCNTLTGSFTVGHIAWAPDGSLDSFSAEFTQRCDSSTGELHGLVNVNAPAPDTTAAKATAAMTPIGVFKRRGGLVAVTATCVDAVDPDPATASDINGVRVQDGQRVTLSKSRTYGSYYRKGTLVIAGPDATLTVVCTDASGNTSSATDSIDL